MMGILVDASSNRILYLVLWYIADAMDRYAVICECPYVACTPLIT